MRLLADATPFRRCDHFSSTSFATLSLVVGSRWSMHLTLRCWSRCVRSRVRISRMSARIQLIMALLSRSRTCSGRHSARRRRLRPIRPLAGAGHSRSTYGSMCFRLLFIVTSCHHYERLVSIAAGWHGRGFWGKGVRYWSIGSDLNRIQLHSFFSFDRHVVLFAGGIDVYLHWLLL